MEDEFRKMRCSFCIKELVLGYVNPDKDYKLCETCSFKYSGHPYYPMNNKEESMSEKLSLSDIINLLCDFCKDSENITSYDRAVYDIHLKDECQHRLNGAIKDASNDVLIEIIKDGRDVPIHHPYCTYSEIFLLEELAIKELTSRGIDPVTFENRG